MINRAHVLQCWDFSWLAETSRRKKSVRNPVKNLVADPVTRIQCHLNKEFRAAQIRILSTQPSGVHCMEAILMNMTIFRDYISFNFLYLERC